MDVMIDIFNRLLSERDVFSWNCHQSDQIVFTVRFQLTDLELRHLEKLGVKSAVGKIGPDSRKVIAYKKKSDYQIDRDAKRSTGLIRKYNANSKQQVKQSSDISSGVDLQSQNCTPSRSGNLSIRSDHVYSKTEQSETKPAVLKDSNVKPKVSSSPKPRPTEKKSSDAVMKNSPGPSVSQERAVPSITQQDILTELKALRTALSRKCLYCNGKLPVSPVVSDRDSRIMYCTDLCRQHDDAEHSSRSDSMNFSPEPD